MGPSDGLAFLLYEQGFDVWMLNTRGNVYSKTHKRPNIKASEYWEFTFHEIGIYDLPNSIDLILSITKQPQLQYVGHSQGSTAFFVMCSELPHYNAKIALMQALSPTVYLQNSLSPVLRYLSLFKGEFSVLLNLLGGFEISRDNTLITQFRDHICTSNVLTSKICEIFDFVLAGFGWNQFNAVSNPLKLFIDYDYDPLLFFDSDSHTPGGRSCLAGCINPTDLSLCPAYKRIDLPALRQGFPAQ